MKCDECKNNIRKPSCVHLCVNCIYYPDYTDNFTPKEDKKPEDIDPMAIMTKDKILKLYDELNKKPECFGSYECKDIKSCFVNHQCYQAFHKPKPFPKLPEVWSFDTTAHLNFEKVVTWCKEAQERIKKLESK